ncbi:MAG: TonB-dependent hemoglobin/transferrin/lactoferrin family receptor [Aeromonadaceae bacterium]
MNDLSKVALAVCAVLASAAHVQAAEGESHVLDQVTVSATRDNKPLEEQQRQVAVVQRGEIEARQIDSVVESLKYESNVDNIGGSRPGAQDPVIRGLSGDRVLQVIDGVRQNTRSGHRGTYFVDPELVEQVDVIKGPSSSLWGSGALGGVVSTRTRGASDLLKADQVLGGYVKQGYHSADDKSLTSGAIYGRTDGQKGDWLLNGYYNDSNDIRLGNGQALQDSAARQQGGMGKFGWNPDDAQRLELSLRHSESNQSAPSNPSANVSSSVPLVQQQTKDFNSTLDYHYTPDNPLLDSRVTAYYNKTQFDEYRIAKGQQDEIDYQTLGLNANNRAELALGSLLSGVDLYFDKTQGSREGAQRPIPADGRSRVWGAFAQYELPFLTDWTLTPGIRFDQFHTEDKQLAGSARTDDDWSPSVGLAWEATRWLTLGARYDEAFRAPTSEELFTSGTHFCMGPTMCNRFQPNPDLKAETAKNKELSARLAFEDLFSDDHLALNASWFDNDIDNFIEQQVINDFRNMIFQTRYNNVSQAQLRGYELAADYSWQSLTLNMGYGQTRGTNKTTGDALSGIPADKWVFGVNQGLWNDQVMAGARLSHYGHQDRVPASNDVAGYDGYTLLDVAISWQPEQAGWQNWRVNLAIDNLTDRYYLPAFNQLYAPGRNGKLSVAYQF